MPENIRDWLSNLGFTEYADAFVENRLALTDLSDLTEDDLRELGIAAMGDRKRLMRAIASLSNIKAPSADVESTLSQETLSSAAERRQLTVMFCDLAGSTALSTRLDPEDYRDVVRAYQDACAGVVARYDGYVAKFMGDGVLAYFGWPSGHENDAERSISAGLGIVEAVSEIAPAAGETVPLAVRIGIATGPVVVGDIVGKGAAQEAAVTGETPNLAARLQNLAELNTIVIAKTTYELAGGLFDYEPLGERALKGIDRATEVWRVIGERRVESRFAATHSTALTPLIAREEELALLSRRWQRANDGEGQVVLLSGEPGLGKSRLTRALQDWIGDKPYTRLLYQGSPHHISSALHPVISQLERSAHIEPREPTNARRDKLEAALAHAGLPPSEFLPLFAALLSIPEDARYPLPAMTPQEQKERTLKALGAQVAGLAARQPVLFIFEDAHWIDPTSLEFMGQVIEQIVDLPVLVVITYRPEFAAPWVGLPHVTLMALNRLNPRDCTRLAEELMGARRLSPEILAQIAERTDGVPLFVEELTRSAVELEAGRNGTKGNNTADIVIPATLQDALEARFDRSPAAREVAQIGAAIGREFSYDLVERVVSLPAADLDTALDELINYELIFARGKPPLATYTFKHALIQDTAYNSMVRSKRRDIHQRIVDALQTLHPEIADTEPELLAHHFTESAQIEIAIDWWTRAGNAAAARSANSEAAMLLKRGLDLVSTLPESDARDRRELAALIALMPPTIAVKGQTSPELEATFSRALELCDAVDAPNEKFRAMYAKWLFHSLSGRHAVAFNQAEEMLRLAQHGSDDDAVLMGHNLIGRSLFFLGRAHEGLDHHNQMLEMFDRRRHGHLMIAYGQDPALIVQSYQTLALAVLGQLEAAKEMGARTISQALDLGHVNSIGPTLCMCGIIDAVVRGDHGNLRQVCDQYRSITSQHDIPIWKAWEEIAVAILGVDCDASLQTVKALRDAIDYLAAQMHARGMYFPLLMYTLAEACFSIGDTVVTLETTAAGLALIDESEERWFEPELYRLRGVALASAGDPGERANAEAAMREAIELAKSGGAKLFELRAATALAGLLRDTGRAAEARELLVPIYGGFVESFEVADVKNAKALLDELG